MYLIDIQFILIIHLLQLTSKCNIGTNSTISNLLNFQLTRNTVLVYTTV